MFPLTHLYTAKAVLGYENRLTALGALFPDYGAFLGLGRNLCHEMGVDMYHYAAENDVSHLDFALGALTHGTALPGIDWYADEEYHGVHPGFCFQQGEALAAETAKICNLPQNMALWKTHNIMELAFDAVTEKKHPGIGKFAVAALPQEGETYHTAFLESYLNQPAASIRQMFSEVSTYFSFDGTDTEDMAKKFIASLKRRHNIENCDKNGLIELIGKAIAIIEPIYDDFMAEALAEIKAALYKRTGAEPPAV